MDSKLMSKIIKEKKIRISEMPDDLDIEDLPDDIEIILDEDFQSWKMIFGKMTAAEIYESMDECMKRYRGMDFNVVLRAVRAHAAVLGRSAGRTEDDILGFYFKMRHLGDH